MAACGHMHCCWRSACSRDLCSVLGKQGCVLLTLFPAQTAAGLRLSR